MARPCTGGVCLDHEEPDLASRDVKTDVAALEGGDLSPWECSRESRRGRTHRGWLLNRFRKSVLTGVKRTGKRNGGPDQAQIRVGEESAGSGADNSVPGNDLRDILCLAHPAYPQKFRSAGFFRCEEWSPRSGCSGFRSRRSRAQLSGRA